MNATLAACATCGHLFGEQDSLDPCPSCGGTERTLRRERLAVDRSEPGRTVTVHCVEERQPDGSCEVVEAPLDESAPAGPGERAPDRGG